MRVISVVALTAILIAVGGACLAEDAAPGHDDGRYTFKEVADGFLRLDTRTGHVSVCSKRSTGWTCLMVPDDRTALEDEIARIEAENARLKKQLAERGLEPHGNETLKLPSDADLDRVMAFLEKAWRRLIDMVESMQRDIGQRNTDRQKGAERM